MSISELIKVMLKSTAKIMKKTTVPLMKIKKSKINNNNF